MALGKAEATGGGRDTHVQRCHSRSLDVSSSSWGRCSGSSWGSWIGAGSLRIAASPSPGRQEVSTVRVAGYVAGLGPLAGDVAVADVGQPRSIEGVDAGAGGALGR